MIGKIAQFCKNFLDWFKSDRCFVKYFIDAFSYTNRNFLLLTLVILFVFGVSMYVMISTVKGANALITLLIVILISSAMAAGFFYSLKKSIDYEQIKIADENNMPSTIDTFYSGVGKHYMKFLGVISLFFILASFLILETFVFANKFVCDISKLGIDMRDFFAILADPNNMDIVVNSLSTTQQKYFRDWNRCFLISTQTFTFLLMFWIPEILYNKKNIFSSLINSIKKIVTDFPNSLCIYLTILFLNYLVAVFTVLSGNNGIIVFLLSIFSLYLLVYDFYAIFLYYKARHIDIYERG